MKKILILCRRDDRVEYDRKESMLAGMAEVQTEATYIGVDYEDLLFESDGVNLKVIDTVSGLDIADVDAAFFIGWFKTKPLEDCARAAALYLKSKNVPFLNSEIIKGRSFTKLTQCVLAVIHGVKVTPFVFCMDANKTLGWLQENPMDFPLITKAISASRGNDNHLVHSIDELRAVLTDTTPREEPAYFIVQDFVPNDGDLRIIVMNGRVVKVIHRQAQDGSHLNNTSKGGMATDTPVDQLPAKVIDDSIAMSRALNREITGVDMIQHQETGEYFLLEVNNMPQLATGSLVKEKMSLLHQELLELAGN